MPAEFPPTGRLLEIACDESGSEGEKLIGGNTDVFAHASVRLSAESAAECIRETRNRIRSPATEYKANHLLRGKHRAVLEWLLGPSGPILGNARVYLIDKTFYAVVKAVDLLAQATAAERQAMALTLHREGPRTYGPQRWTAFLEAFNDLMRGRTSADSFFQLVEDFPPDGRVGEIMGLLGQGRERAGSFLAQLFDGPGLDPLIPAIAQAVVHWGAGGKAVSIVHDETNTLTEERIARLKETFAPSAPDGPPRGRLSGFQLVDSRFDPRVQVADFLAGVARKIASDELNGRGDAELVALLRPFTDSSSVWGDGRSWSLLGPEVTVRLAGM
ncbi:DUF3800 domain-containing protein [Nonomuraea sp. LPB2021202275-12-8]|uniref:DUF3800 domain-containing protein n=1 Tax=Nonomuraea sp. LPB2021202275-12-8 TaxID=3120159 RepID=UPI00300D6A64